MMIGLVRCVIRCSNAGTTHVNLQTVLCIALLGAQFVASYIYTLTFAQSLSSSILSFDSQNPQTKSGSGPFSHLAPRYLQYPVFMVAEHVSAYSFSLSSVASCWADPSLMYPPMKSTWSAATT